MKKILLVIAMGVLMIGCGDKDSKRKELTVYTALENEQIPVYLKSFYKKYPDIKLNIIRDSTGVIISRVLAEKDNPQGDVIWGTAATGVLSLDKVGLLKEYKPKGLEKIDEKFKDLSGATPKWVGNNAWVTAISVNNIELEKLGLDHPKSYKDLLNPKYKGLISMPNPASSGTGFLTVSALFQIMGEESGWKFLENLDKNIGTYTHSGSKPAKTSASGEYPIGISYGYPSIKLLQEGAPVSVYFPKEGSGWDSEANALINKKEIKDEAKIFLDWAISEEVMTLYGKSYGVVSREVENIVPPKGYPKNIKDNLIDNNFIWASDNKERILKTWEKKFGGKTEGGK